MPATVSCEPAELKRNNQYDASLFIKPTEQDCLRLQRERGDMIREGLEIISDLADDNYALKCFLHLEISEIATSKLFAFHTTRCQFFQDLA